MAFLGPQVLYSRVSQSGVREPLAVREGIAGGVLTSIYH